MINGRRATDRAEHEARTRLMMFCQPPSATTNVPLRCTPEAASLMATFEEYRHLSTATLIMRAESYGHVHVTDRWSAIAVLRGAK